jgi:hypothetical protein
VETGTVLATLRVMPRVTLLGALVLHDPEQARSIIRTKAAKHDGNLVHTATALAVTHRQMRRWVTTLGLDVDLDLIRAKAGVHPGQIKSSKKRRASSGRK